MDSILARIKEHRKSLKPVVVHCSAGIGRTGTLIAISAIIESVEWSLENKDLLDKVEYDDEIKKRYTNINKPRISVFGAVRKMRE